MLYTVLSDVRQCPPGRQTKEYWLCCGDQAIPLGRIFFRGEESTFENLIRGPYLDELLRRLEEGLDAQADIVSRWDLPIHTRPDIAALRLRMRIGRTNATVDVLTY